MCYSRHLAIVLLIKPNQTDPTYRHHCHYHCCHHKNCPFFVLFVFSLSCPLTPTFLRSCLPFSLLPSLNIVFSMCISRPVENPQSDGKSPSNQNPQRFQFLQHHFSSFYARSGQSKIQDRLSHFEKKKIKLNEPEKRDILILPKMESK